MGESGCTLINLMSGSCSRKRLPVPVNVPLVPNPATKCVNLPFVCSRISTAEDPVEYLLPGINQVEVRAHIGLTFQNIIRAMLRQAPNVILVGEIRDEHETDEDPELVRRQDGTLIVDARLDIEAFEEEVGAVLTEEEREDIDTLPRLLAQLQESERRWIVFSDDLSFDAGDECRSLKGVLEGGLEGRPENVVLYATSNRRHILAREIIENEQSTALRPSEAVDENISLSDRFGLWLGFHPATQDEYFAIVEGYAAHFGLEEDTAQLRHAAAEWSVTRGARSGRVAWQFIQDLAGKLGKPLD